MTLFNRQFVKCRCVYYVCLASHIVGAVSGIVFFEGANRGVLSYDYNDQFTPTLLPDAMYTCFEM